MNFEISFGGKICNFISLYRSPSQSSDTFEDFADNWELNLVKNANKSPYLLVLRGDFNVKGCVCCIFTNLFCMSKREDLRNKGKCFLFHFKISFRSWDNQILNFQIFKNYDVIKCLTLNTKHVLMNKFWSKHILVMKFG